MEYELWKLNILKPIKQDNKEYYELKNNQIIDIDDVEILQNPPILLMKYKGAFCFVSEISYPPKGANAILLGGKSLDDVFYAASFCKMK